MQIGLSSCSIHEFQFEMRQVKFLLDYQGAREVEYRLTRERRPVTCERTNFVSSVCLTFLGYSAMVDADLTTSVPYT